MNASNTNGSSEYTSYIYIELTTSPEPIIPTTPSNLIASNITDSSFTASWTTVNGASSYHLQRWSDAQNVWLDAGTSTTNSKGITGLTVQDQWVRIKAINSAGSSDYSGYIHVQLLTATVAPTTPTDLSITNITNSSFTASWTAVEGASSYRLQRWSDAQNAWLDAGTSTTNSKNIAGLTSQDQWVRVKATNAAGSSDYSGYVYVSLLIDCTSAPAIPSSLGGNSQTLHWNAVAKCHKL